jgi:hypothetical protein
LSLKLKIYFFINLIFLKLNTTLDNIGSNNNNTNNLIVDESSIENLKKKRKLNLNNITTLNSRGGGISPNKRSRKLNRPIRAIEGNNIEETIRTQMVCFIIFLLF